MMARLRSCVATGPRRCVACTIVWPLGHDALVCGDALLALLSARCCYSDPLLPPHNYMRPVPSALCAVRCAAILCNAAPEIMLACQHYGIAIDVWAVGCIYAELLGTKPLFPGAWRRALSQILAARLMMRVSLAAHLVAMLHA